MRRSLSRRSKRPSQSCTVRPGSPVRGSRRCLARWWICWAKAMLSGRPRSKPSILASRSWKKRADTGDEQHVSVFTTLLRAKVTWWRMTELGLFMTLPCFGGMRRRNFSVASELFAAQIQWLDSSGPGRVRSHFFFGPLL